MIEFSTLLLLVSLFCLSTIRNLIPGFVIFFTIIFNNYNLIKKLKISIIFFLLIIYISIFSMVLLGTNPTNNIGLHFDYTNYFVRGWNDLFIIRNIFFNYKLFFLGQNVPIILNIGWLLLFAFILFYNIPFINFLFRKNNKLIISYFILYIIINLFSIILYKNSLLFFCSMLLIYTTPIYVISKYLFKVQNNFYFYLFIFILLSLFQIFFLSPSSSIPNAILLDYILFFILFKNIKIEDYKMKYPYLAILLLLPILNFKNMLFPPSTDSNTFSINLRDIKTKDNLVPIDGNLDQDFIIKTSILGKRYNFNKNISDTISMSKNFISK
jgi:hypothetical protein